MGQREHLFSLTKNDFEFQAFRGGGPGGQHQNKNDTAMRCVHRPSGAVGESREFKSQHQNKQQAFRRMTQHPKFTVWINRKCWEMMGADSIEKRIEKAMTDDKIRVEIKQEGKWVTVGPEYFDNIEEE